MQQIPAANRLGTALPALLALPTLLSLGGCGEGEAGVPDAAAAVPVRMIESPAGPDSGEPNLTVGPDGTYLSWLERTAPDRHALRFARWDGAAWSEPVTVMDRTGLFVNWADFPSMLVLDDGTLAAHWLEKSGPGAYSYDVRIAVSTDGGRSWSDDVVPHRDGVQAEHGFVSMFPVDGRIGAVWLDGRATVDGKPMTLRFGTVGRDAEPGAERLIDDSVCDCCQTSVALAAGGPVVAYRGRTADEIRDIRVARRVDGDWTPGVPVHEDGWKIPACPVNGPAIDAEGDRVAVAWFTGATDAEAEPSREDLRRMGETGRVLAAFSEDGGASFGPPVRVDENVAMGRVGLVLTPEGDAVVSWVERVDGAAEVRIRRVGPGAAGPITTVAGTAAARASGFPRIALRGEELMIAWTETGDPARVRTATARVTAAGPETVAGDVPAGGVPGAGDRR